MRMAIQWVHDHISVIGGDSKRVTLFGNSAGGVAVMYQAMYPKNKDLFHRIIAQSGSSFAFWPLQKDPSKNFAQYVNDVGCDVNDYEEIRKCLQNKPTEELLTYSWVFEPTVDGDFLLEEPADLFSEESLYGNPVQKFFSEIDFMNGVTSGDGAMSIPVWTEKLKVENIDINTGVPRHYFEDVYIPESLTGIFGLASTVLKKSVIHQYTDWSRPDDAEVIREKMIEFASDVAFFAPAVTASQKHSAVQRHGHNSKSYFYVFDHKPSFIPEPDWLKGATHTMEVAYIFGLHRALERKLVDDLNAVDPLTTTKDDIKLSKVMMTMWTNFAKSGNPNTPVDPETIEWPAFNNDGQRYVELSTLMTSQSVKHHLAASRVSFWNDLVPVLEKCNPAQPASDASSPSFSLFYLIMILCFYAFY